MNISNFYNIFGVLMTSLKFAECSISLVFYVDLKQSGYVVVIL